ncbi:glutamine synthetase family protein [Allobranchiibius sp. CTAmp26]|uniref:glutamine synthetase family protein n=1 Tax=Allobranchiibius sp. CTAmp26 TaxID=2815214 RepID=UPI001AA1586C|nr:glutamine synthetase family protein [Allobranchiibius sp. CTAmp26]MBO1753636.1 glutamine synthetase [Allobranchiibius sp. CTAmp26]
MTTSQHADREKFEHLRTTLETAGVHAVLGTTVNAAGLTLAKSVPMQRFEAFHRTGLGAARVWPVFCIDAAIASAPGIDATGDLRLRIDIDAVRDIGNGLAWAPADLRTQQGHSIGACTRSLLTDIETHLASAGLTALVGHELEFVLVAPDGAAQGGGWVPYGATGLLDQESFAADLLAAAGAAGLRIEQLHSEYGPQQFEFSLAPAAPVATADAVVLAKLLVGRTARRHGLRASFSPKPFHGAVGNGAHQHFSLWRDGRPLFGGGDGPHGLTLEGGAAIGGILRGLADVQGLLTGSLLSGARLSPGMWSGAHAGWGLENRETAVRLIQGGAPEGSNVEVKCIDPSAGVYAATAAVLALALDGITDGAALPDEVEGDPSGWSDEDRAAAGVPLLSDDLTTILAALDGSERARRLLGDDIVDATVGVRRHELDTYGDREPEEVADLFRLAWSI